MIARCPSPSAQPLPVSYAEAREADARAVQETGVDGEASPHYVIEKGWFDNFLLFIEDNGTNSHPGSINNKQLLRTESSAPSEAASIDLVPPAEENESENEKRRQMRKQKWHDKERNFEALSAEKSKELLGGNKTMASDSLALTPNLLHETDYVLVGEKVWDVITKNFHYDVEIPRRSYYESDAKGNKNGKANTQADKRSLVVEIYSPENGELQAEMDTSPNNTSRVVMPPSGRWNFSRETTKSTNIEEKTSSMSNIISEGDGSSPEDSCNGSDENMSSSKALFKAPQSTNKDETQIVPFNQAQVSLTELYAKRKKALDCKSDADTSDEDIGSPAPARDEQEEVRSTATKRKRATGLGNLGNTCFMNSTLQCLAHTPPLRQYFTTGEFRKDLNKDNPLGTGGELATEFASLLRQMWGIKQTGQLHNHQNGNVYSSSRVYSTGNYDSGISSVTYPRTFKHTLGKHAEQFMGYDQHDSQELAIYLLDALHEDTNRVTKKPYVEKPEQAEDESDDVAAKKAWNVHLQREDSRILENFMGQIKSRLQCSRKGCGRVSTTFDPCMYLSVPIPGAMDKIVKVTFVPLNPQLPSTNLVVKLNKMATISALRKHVISLAMERYGFTDNEICEEDIQFADVWSSESYSFYGDNYEVDRIRDKDVTYAYQLYPLSAVKKEFAAYREQQKKSETNCNSEHEAVDNSSLDEEEKKLLDTNDRWQQTLGDFLSQPLSLYKCLNRSRSTHEERVDFYRKLIRFVQSCRKCSDFHDLVPPQEDDISGTSNGTSEKASASNRISSLETDDSLLTLEEQCQMSTSFKNIRTSYDVARLEYCVFKFREYMTETLSEKQSLSENGVTVQIIFKRNPPRPSFQVKSRASWKSAGTPIVARISPTLTVSELRKVIGRRISKALRPDAESNHHLATTGPDDSSLSTATPTSLLPGMDPETSIMRQIALSYETKSSSSQYYHFSEVMGSVTKEHLLEGTPAYAKPSDDEEKELVAKLVGEEGKIFLGWPTRLYGYIDDDALGEIEEFLSEQQKKERARSLANKVSVMDCISKYCQIEQLEESEMWYCNRCKEHVQAWKQFHLYRTPPILIVHLKRFHFSSTTHRRDKIDTLIDFPLTDLDLTDMVMHWEEGEKPIYDCYAVSNHFGGLGGGHYTAYAKGDDGLWCNFDDSRVTSGVDESEIVSNAAYCLYYKRKDVSFDKDKEIDDLTQGMGPHKPLVGPCNVVALQEMDVDDVNSSTPPSPCLSPVVSFNGDQIDNMEGRSMPPVAIEWEREPALQ